MLPVGPDAGWEPVPWDAGEAVASRQRLGFLERVGWAVVWYAIPWRAFPAGGVFGHDKSSLIRAEITACSTHGGEDMLLVRRAWNAWPDPPEWGLATRTEGARNMAWQDWGSFPMLPSAWQVPDAIG